MASALSHGLLVALLLLLPPAASQEVLVGTADNFNDLLKAHDKILVEFYAPWCGHCKNLAPEYEKAAVQLHEQGLQTKLMKVDATAERALAEMYAVESYPTLKYFSKRKPEEFGNARTADAIVKWLRKREVGAFKVIGEAGVAEFLDSHNRWGSFSVVARVKKGSVRDKAFQAALAAPLLAEHESTELHFAVVYLPKGADAKKDASLRMRRPGFAAQGEAEDVEMPGAWSEKSVGEWILQNTFPVVGTKFEVAKYSVEMLEKLGWEAAVVAVLDAPDEDDGDESEGQKQVKAMLKGLAPKYPKWKFAAVTYKDMDAGAQEVLAAEGDPCITVLLSGKKYRLLEAADGDTFGEAEVADFLEQVREKKAKPHYKSEAPPANPLGEDNVLTITGKTFEEFALDSKKDVFVEFYAPWCGHCQKLAPEWSKLGKKVKSEGWDAKGVVVAKMDAVANDCEQEVGGFPKLVLYPAVPAQKKMRARLDYSGARELDPMVDFLLENAKNLDGVELKAGTKEGLAKRELKKRKGASKKSEL